MATIFGGRRNSEPRSGGKMMRGRQASMARRTPYARPEPPPETSAASQVSKNPNWLSSLIYPARAIATGAGRLLSSVLDSDSSSSSDSDDEDLNSDDLDDECENNTSEEGDDQSEKVLSTMTTPNKRLIAQLVIREAFSRKECYELTKLIESRVRNEEDMEPESGPDIWSTAIKEAKNWLQEKNLSSDSKSKYPALVSNPSPLPLCTYSEAGSPVDMAKSYMQDRPAWGSPSLRHVEFNSPSPTRLQRFRDETPKSIPGSSLLAVEKRMTSLATGSWNLQEEMRRVRSKQTEELLAKRPSKNINISLPPANELTRDPIINGIAEVVIAAPIQRVHEHDKAEDDIVAATDGSCVSKPDTDGKAIQADKSEDNGFPANTTSHDTAHMFAEPESNGQDSILRNEGNGQSCAAVENGISCPVYSMSVEPTMEPESISDDEKLVNSFLEDVTVEADYEYPNATAASVDVSVVVESDSVVSGSQNSAGIRDEDGSPPWEPKSNKAARTRRGRPVGKAGKTSPAHAARGYSRRGRGRGK